MNSTKFIIFFFTLLTAFSCDYSNKEARNMNSRFYAEPEIKLNSRIVNGVQFQYRTAGNPLNPTLLLLHGFPTTKKTFDELIPMLASHYYVVAPDNTDSDWTTKIDPRKTSFTFSLITDYMEYFLKDLEINSYTLYLQNSAFHVGFQLMERNPSKIDALIIQNADLYMEGMSEERKALYEEKNGLSTDAYKDYLSSLTKNINSESDSPQIKNLDLNYWRDQLQFVQTEKQRLAMIQLLHDYNNVVKRFPEWQKMLNKNQPKSLIIWGDDNSDTDFNGAKSYLKDLPEAELLLINSDKFSNKMANVEVASKVLKFLQSNSNHLEGDKNLKSYLDAL